MFNAKTASDTGKYIHRTGMDHRIMARGHGDTSGNAGTILPGVL